MIAPFYAAIYAKLPRIAARFGYAIAIHGSLQRDMDFVLIPWTEDADEPEKVLRAIQKFIGGPGKNHDPMQQTTQKPHGRTAYIFYFDNGACVDISVMPRIKT